MNLNKIFKYGGGSLCLAADIFQIILIILKLCNVITIDWPIVLLPLEIIGGSLLILLLISVYCACIISGRSE